MKLINFKLLEGKNFLSFGDNPTTIKLKPGVNAITGVNLDKEDSKNGAGKSSVTELLYYAFYGTTLREIGKDFVQNSVTNKRLEVSLTFDVIANNTTDEYKIVRKLNPTKCSLFKNGEDITRSTLAKTNKLIQDLIHTPSTVFQNSVIMSVNTAMPFMALAKTDKRKFIESVLGLEVFTSMVLKARDDYSIIKKDYEIAYSKLEQLETQFKFNSSQLENYETEKQNRINKLLDKKTKIGSDIEELKTKILNIKIANIEDYNNQLKLLTSKQTDLNNAVNSVKEKVHKNEAITNLEQKQIDKFKQSKESCPTCQREYSDEHKHHVNKQIEEHEKTILKHNKENEAHLNLLTELENKRKGVETLISEINEKVKLENQKQTEINLSKTSIQHLETNLKEAIEEISAAQNLHNNDLKSKIAELTTEVDKEKSKTEKLNNELNVLETVKFVLSEEGIKSYIVKKILQVLNSRLAYYLKKLETNCLCQFNEYFDEIIIDEKGSSKSYFNFSGGERKRIDLACLFTFLDIRRLQGDVNFNTIFYDELLDSSLDDKGVSLTLKILKERYEENNESCYIITHRGPEVTTEADHVIKVVKQNGISTVTS